MSVGNFDLETAPELDLVELDPRVAVLQSREVSRAEREAASASIFEEFRPPVYRCAYRVLESPLDAEDATQETFLRVFNKIETYTPMPPYTFGHWVLKIARNRAIDIGEYRKRRPAGQDLESVYRYNEFYLPIETQETPESQFFAKFDQEALKALLGRITPEFVAPVTLRLIEDLDYDTIAQRLGIPAATARTRVHRGRKELQKILTDN